MGIDDMYFDYKLIKREVTSSWSRCLKENKKRYVLNDNMKKENNTNQISKDLRDIFINTSTKLNQIIKSKHCLLLVNKEKIIEELLGDIHFKNKLIKNGINIGSSFAEKYTGTNAVDLAEKMMKPAYILPGHHFCKPLNSWYSLAYPIKIYNQTFGYVNLISEISISKEVVCLIDLFSKNLSLRFNESKKENNKISLNDLSYNQNYILKKLAVGFTEKELAKDMHLSKSTVKYHKKILFNKFKVSSKIELVIKAIKIGLLTFEEV